MNRMNRVPILVSLMSISLLLTPGCTTKKKGCAGKGKTPCPAGCKTPCGKRAGAPAAPTNEPPCHAAKGSGTHFGNPMKLSDKDAVCSKKVLAAPDKYDGKYIRVVGKVAEVCARRGCWLKLGDATGKETIFVKFTCPVTGRLIPMEAVGKMALVEGTLKATEISEEEARHYKEDAGASPGEVAKIVGPQKTVKMASPAARIMGL